MAAHSTACWTRAHRRRDRRQDWGDVNRRPNGRGARRRGVGRTSRLLLSTQRLVRLLARCKATGYNHGRQPEEDDESDEKDPAKHLMLQLN